MSEEDMTRIIELTVENDEQQSRQQQGQQQQRAGARLLPPPSQPMQVARQFVEQHCLYNGAREALTLRHWHGGWWVWHGSHWVEVEARAVRALLYAFTEHAQYWKVGKDGKPPELTNWAPTRYKIGDLLEALSAITIRRDRAAVLD
jgi:putative DNA primase/helicase